MTTPPKEVWLFTETELDRVTDILLYRYRAMSANDVFDCPDSIGLLFAWMQGGDEQGPRRLIEDHIKSDEGFVETLENLLSEISSSDRGTFKILKKENLTYFMDYEKAAHRVHNLKNGTDLGRRANRLAEALKLAADY